MRRSTSLAQPSDRTARLAAAAAPIVAGLVMGALAWLAIWATRGTGRVAAVWPANAVMLACLIGAPVRRWPWFLLSAFLCDAIANLLVGDRLQVAAAVSGCNIVEILVAAGGLRRLVGPKLDFGRVRHLALFAALSAVASALAAFGGVSALELGGRLPFWRSLAGWALADTLGLLIVTPALLALGGPAFARFAAPGAVARNLGVLALHVAVAWLVFLEPRLQLRYLVFASLILVAFRAEIVGAALAVLATGVMVVAMAAAGGIAPPASDALLSGPVALQLFLLVCAAVTMPVGAAVARRRELSAALEATARDYQTLADHSTDIIARTDLEGRIVYVSPSCRWLGYEPHEAIGRTVFSFLSPDDLGEVRGTFAQAVSGGAPSLRGAFERRVRTASGELVWLEGSPQLILDGDGRPSGVISQLRDITARKAAQAALAESEARYRMLAERATDIILQSDPDGTISYISPACRRLGYAPEDMVGRSALEFIHPDDRAQTMERLRGLFAGDGRPASDRREYRALARDGEMVWLEGNSTVLHDEAGGVVGAISLLRDVTERRAFEDELRRKRAEAEAATVAKSEFLANMSHEIRTPLTGIMGFAGLLEAAEALPSQARAYASRIATASRALLSVVNDILDFSKIEAGQVDLDPRPFDPRAFLTETVELVAAQAGEKSLALAVRLADDLPAAVFADADRLRQVLLNLLTNAVKFTDAGSVAVTARHEPAEGGRLCVEVADTGVGVAPDRLGRLFQRFSQADGSINRQYGGTGLGLAICKSLTTLMGGEIGVDSRPGGGARFWFTIAAPPCAPTPEPVAAEEPEAQSAPARILVVDDSPVNRELVGVLLSVSGHALTEAGGGAEAVEAAARSSFDLILMDLQMPGMDGLAAAREIRARCPLNAGTPIVALSANILPAHLEACRAAGMDDHIGKPIDTRELLSKVARWTGEADARGEAADVRRRS